MTFHEIRLKTDGIYRFSARLLHQFPHGFQREGGDGVRRFEKDGRAEFLSGEGGGHAFAHEGEIPTGNFGST